MSYWIFHSPSRKTIKIDNVTDKNIAPRKHSLAKCKLKYSAIAQQQKIHVHENHKTRWTLHFPLLFFGGGGLAKQTQIILVIDYLRRARLRRWLWSNILQNLKYSCLTIACSSLPIQNCNISSPSPQFQQATINLSLMLRDIWSKEWIIHICRSLTQLQYCKSKKEAQVH